MVGYCSTGQSPQRAVVLMEEEEDKHDLVARGSLVDIETRYGLDGPGIESRRRRDFPHLSRQALGPT
jgi:hypothetical protein